ncbi:AcrR family transcriptional regulator [Rhodococcus sp. 27YEA15]|uniref:TetR/AcrR family transcriptional regulator n=1 Tax=Rhodococcus sp. 27YEA15 TaxID=3156259 RepID=UPI003C798461
MSTTHPDATVAGHSADSAPPRLRSDAQANLGRILCSAREVFAAHGLDATLADVARHAGVGVGTVYRRFSSKDELIQALFDNHCAEIESVAAAAGDIANAWDGLLFFVETMAGRMADNRGFGDLLMDARFESDTFTRARSSIFGHTAVLVDRAKEQGSLRADFDVKDIPLLMQMIKAAQRFGGDEAPDAYRRLLGFVTDGLCSSRTGHCELPVPPLTEQQLDRVLHRYKSGPSC